MKKELENLKNLKCYDVYWSSDGYPGRLIGYYATKEDAQEGLRKFKETDGRDFYDYHIEEVSVFDLIQTECEIAVIESGLSISQELREKYEKEYQTEYEKEVAKEKKRLQKELRKFLKEWCDTDQTEGV